MCNETVPLQTCEFTIYVCIQSRACAHRHVDEHAHTHIHAHTHTHTHTHSHANTRIHTHANHMCTWHLFTVPDTFCYDVTLSESEIRVVARRPDVMKRGHCKHASSQHMCAHSRARARTCTSTTTRTHTHAHTHANTCMRTTCVRNICLRWQRPFATT